ncbi:MAG: zinc-binding dehydrogenase [Planctomycetes bacterium]|nr:zinc-binding dehydrogenase [Planctomycetota bacterium]
MKAAILVEQNGPLVIDDVEIPPLAPGQSLVRIEYSGICGKQMEEISGRRGKDPHLPHLLGHEGGGVVEEIGPGVRKVKPGDHVVLHWMKGSGIDSATPKFKRDGSTVNAGWVTTFSERSVVSENRLTPIPASIPLDVASLLGCAVTTGLGIVFNNASLKPGQSIAVFGTGGVGLNVVQGAALVNAFPIAAVDLHECKLEKAREFGATHLFQAGRPGLEDSLMELSGGRGFDAAVDVTGNNKIRQLAYDLTANSGRTILAGVPHCQDQITIDSFPLHFGRTIIGSHGGDTAPDRDIPRYIKLHELGKLKLDELITHRFRLEEINEAVEQMKSGKACRCIIAMR